MSDKSWLDLGTRVSSEQSNNEILLKSKGDYTVTLSPVLMHDDVMGKIATFPNRFIINRVSLDQTHRIMWEVVKERYSVAPNSSILDRARDIVAKANGAASLHSCGVLEEGRKFFVAVKHSSTKILSTMGEDIVDNYIVVITSHDGSMPICYYNLDVRAETNSVYRFSADADFSLRKRHTPNETIDPMDATEALTMRQIWSEKLDLIISEFTSSHMSADKMFKVMEKFWSTQGASSAKKRSNAEDVHDTIKTIYRQPHNLGRFGETKWAAYNAITEYIDFHRDIPPIEAAQHSLELDNFSHRLKVNVFNAIKDA